MFVTDSAKTKLLKTLNYKFANFYYAFVCFVIFRLLTEVLETSLKVQNASTMSFLILFCQLTLRNRVISFLKCIVPIIAFCTLHAKNIF